MRKNKNGKRFNNKKSNGLSLYKQIADSEIVEVGFYHNLIDYQNDARDLFTQMNSGSVDFSQYRDLFANFKMLNVEFRTIPAYVYTVTPSDNAMGMFAVRQGIYESSPFSQSVSTVVQYPGTRDLHNYKSCTASFKVNNGDWFTNTEVNSATSRVAKVTYYAAWYKVATTNTAQGITQVRVKLAAKCRLI